MGTDTGMKLYTIEPLEWKIDGTEAFSRTGISVYLGKVDDEWHWCGDFLPGGPCASLADGQAQAEACWQARLAGVLEEEQ